MFDLKPLCLLVLSRPIIIDLANPLLSHLKYFVRSTFDVLLVLKEVFKGEFHILASRLDSSFRTRSIFWDLALLFCLYPITS